MFLVSGEDIKEKIRDLVSQGAPLDVAIAFWGVGAVAELGFPGLAFGSRILVNATSGACNPLELERLALLAPSVETRHCDRLHAKVVRGKSIAVVGSANASGAGLGFSSSSSGHWVEAGVTIDDAKAILDMANWYNSIWEDSEPLSEALIDEARVLWKRRAGAEILTARVTRSSVPPGGVYVALLSTDAETGLIEAAERLLNGNGFLGASAFQGWARIPKDATIICFETEPALGQIRWEGVWRSLPEPSCWIPFGTSRRRIQVVVPEASFDISEFGMNMTDLTSDTHRMALAARRHPGEAQRLFKQLGGEFNDYADWCLRLSDFVSVMDAFVRRAE